MRSNGLAFKHGSSRQESSLSVQIRVHLPAAVCAPLWLWLKIALGRLSSAGIRGWSGLRARLKKSIFRSIGGRQALAALGCENRSASGDLSPRTRGESTRICHRFAPPFGSPLASCLASLGSPFSIDADFSDTLSNVAVWRRSHISSIRLAGGTRMALTRISLGT